MGKRLIKKCKSNLNVRIYNKSGMRASGLIPVIPLTTIIKYTQLLLCIVEQANNYCCPDWYITGYLYQSGKVHNVLSI